MKCKERVISENWEKERRYCMFKEKGEGIKESFQDEERRIY